jgi:hypothetical protein
MSQAFEDGNKRTAYHTTRAFLAGNGLGHVSPVTHDDEELADHLVGHGEGTHLLEDTQAMLAGRLGRTARTAEYRMQHRAPGPDDAPMHDLTANGVFPEDVYTHPHYYFHDSERDSDSYWKVIKYRNKPEAMVQVYRAAPVGTLNPGDWVTPNKAYARDEGKHPTDPSKDMPVWSHRVPADCLHCDGNSLSEWGYNGPHVIESSLRWTRHGWAKPRGYQVPPMTPEAQAWLIDMRKRSRDAAAARRQANAPSQAPHHHNPFTGLPCSCQWGLPSPTRTASQAINKLRKQDQKALRTPEGQQFLTALGGVVEQFPAAERLVPWLAARYKAGEIQVGVNGELSYQYMPLTRTLPNWIQWMEARQHPLRRGRDIMQMSAAQVDQLARELREDLTNRQVKENWLNTYGQTGTRVHTFHPEQAQNDEEQDLLNQYKGWHVHQLHSSRDTEAESDALNHCIGSDGQPYKSNIEEGNIAAHSLRDPEGYPRLTWHHNPDDTLAHIQGKGTPKEDWRKLVSLFHDAHGLHDDDGYDGDEQPLGDVGRDHEVEWPDVENVDQYIDQYHPEADLYEQAREMGYDPHEEAEFHLGDPDWGEVYNDLMTASPEQRQNFYHTVIRQHRPGRLDDHVQGFRGEALQRINDNHPIASQIASEFDKVYNQSFTPTGQFAAPDWVVDPNTWAGRWRTQMQQDHPKLFDMNSLGESTYAGGRVLGNILDPIHDTLTPLIWLAPADSKPHLKPKIRHWIIDAVTKALAKHGYDGMESWLTLCLTGSLTTYQYDTHSDCDVSLFIDSEVFPEWSRAEMIGIMVSEFDNVPVPGTPFPLQAFVVMQGLRPEDLYKPGLRSGYNLMTDQWIVPPDRTRVHDVEREDNADYTYALEVADKMDRLLRYEPEKAVMYYKQIHKRRMADQTKGKGDFSQANIVYKMLDNRGLFQQLRGLGVKIAVSIPGDWDNPFALRTFFGQGEGSPDMYQRTNEPRPEEPSSQLANPEEMGFAKVPKALEGLKPTFGSVRQSMARGLETDPVEQWVNQGKVVPFSQLPESHQRAVAHYMAVDGEAWPLYEDLAKGLPVGTPQWSQQYLDRAMPRYLADPEIAGTPFGMTEIPMQHLTRAIMDKNHDVNGLGGDWDKYHAWYCNRGDMADHDVSKPLWPVFLDRYYPDVLQDGWHRLHDYYRKGVQSVPAVFYPDRAES